MPIPVVDRFQVPFPRSTIGNRFGIKGPFYGPQGHRGVDFVQPAGADVTAIAHGKVVSASWSDGLGNVIVVQHRLKKTIARRIKARITREAVYVYSGYCHLSKRLVEAGAVVKRGQHIGEVGTTGKLSSGNHLHMTLSDAPTGVFYGDVQDPIAFIDSHAGA